MSKLHDILSSLITRVKKAETQKDWNQNDPTAPDYVKNRLAWTDDPVETVLLEETELTFVDGGAELPTPIQLTEGQTYVVTYNGNAYDCTAWLWEVEGIVFIGNGALVDESVENDKPFITDGALMMSINADASATIRIIEVAAEVHKIDEKYLPKQTHYDNRTMILVDYDSDNYADVIYDADGNEAYHYLTSDTFTVEEFIGKRMDFIEFGERYGNTIMSDWVEDINGDGTLISIDGAVIICNAENTVFNDITFPYKGLYVMSPDYRGCDYALQIYEGSYKQLDKKYLPDSVQSDIETAKTMAETALGKILYVTYEYKDGSYVTNVTHLQILEHMRAGGIVFLVSTFGNTAQCLLCTSADTSCAHFETIRYIGSDVHFTDYRVIGNYLHNYYGEKLSTIEVS